MWSKISETLKSVLPGSQTEANTVSRKRHLEGLDSVPMPDKRKRPNDLQIQKPVVLLKKAATWVVSKHRSFQENYYIRQITNSPKTLMKKISNLSSPGQEEMPVNRQTFIQHGLRVDQGSEVRYGRDIMNAMQGMQIHSTPVNNPAKGYCFTDANFDLDQPDMFSFLGSPVGRTQFQGRGTLQPRIQDLSITPGQDLTSEAGVLFSHLERILIEKGVDRWCSDVEYHENLSLTPKIAQTLKNILQIIRHAFGETFDEELKVQLKGTFVLLGLDESDDKQLVINVRPPIRPQYGGSSYENQTRTNNGSRSPGYRSIYEKVFSGQGQPRRRYHGQRYRSKMAVRESIRMEERTRYAELLQQFTAAPVVNKVYSPSNMQNTVTGVSRLKNNETVLGTRVIDIGPEQLSDGSLSSVDSKTEKVQVNARQGQPISSMDVCDLLASSSFAVPKSWPLGRSRDNFQHDPVTIDLTGSGDNSNHTVSSNDAGSRDSDSPVYETKASLPESRSVSPPISSFNKSLQESKYIKDDWLQDMLNRITLESKQLKNKAEEEEIKAKYYKDKRKQWDEDLERRIHLRIRQSEREPPVFGKSDESKETDEFPDLTEEQDEMVDSALVPYPKDQKIAGGFRLELTRNDIQTLNRLNWLNDEVINFYMNLLMERSSQDGLPKVHAFNTFFYPKIIKSGQQSVRRWTKKVDIFSMDYILVPVHLGMHWCLAVVDFRKKEIRYYDSMGGNNRTCLEALRKYLIDESLEKRKERFDMSDWKLNTVKDIPQQMNGSDCGMFACKFAEYVTRDAPITFSQCSFHPLHGHTYLLVSELPVNSNAMFIFARIHFYVTSFSETVQTVSTIAHVFLFAATDTTNSAAKIVESKETGIFDSVRNFYVAVVNKLIKIFPFHDDVLRDLVALIPDPALRS
ncbi:hypothetical protein LSH36_82g00005 [Paralvinella palmiformis]|uniref:Ubiquitin-like protease family profile domain-containing protein n=1 Tax=Paralvinella palmiformis TaxID=53620 RepID=A0AAD9K1N8_9ANNE|nr:hypothetical protein LSH36_82g00005 [Paralvinella palmiformis]